LDAASDPPYELVGKPTNGGREAGRRYVMGNCVSRHPHDELRALERRTDPAWLWDAGRNRLVWANRAGLAFWGEATILDLIDRRLDERDAAVARMASLVTTLEPGTDSVQTLVFEISGHTEAVQMNCRRIILEDGRPGLLVVRMPDAADGPALAETRTSLLEAVVEQMPSAVAIFDRHGSLLYQNDAARNELSSAPAETNPTDLDGETPDSGSLLAAWLGDASKADVMSRTLSRGSVSEAVILQTKFGARAHRINARRLAAPVVGRLAVFMVFEDIEDRRRLEHRQAEALTAIEAVLGAADATFEIDAEGRLVDFGGAAQRVFGNGIGVLLGTEWDDVLAALELKGAVPFSQRRSSPGPWREILSPSAAGAQALVIAAMPIIKPDGGFDGYRGLVLALDATSLPSMADPSTKTETSAPGAPATNDEAEFLADLQKDQPADEPGKKPDDAVGGPNPPDTKPAGDTAKGGKVGRDDAATFTAIAQALDSARKPVKAPSPEALASGAATLRVVGGVEALSPDQPPTDSGLDLAADPDGGKEVPESSDAAQALLETGKPTLIHRHFVILDANDMLARLLGHDNARSLLRDTNLLNLMPDERAKLFSLQSRFDDRDLPQFGRIDEIPLKARKKDRTTLNIQASFEEVQLDGATAIRVVAEEAQPQTFARTKTTPAEPEAGGTATPGAMAPSDVTSRPLDTGATSGSTALSAAVARETELRAVINTAADGIATVDVDGRIITLNASAEAIFGIEAPVMAGQKFEDLFTAQSAETIRGYISSITSEQPARLHREGHEVSGKRPGGGVVPLFVTIGRMNVAEGLQYCAVIRDISQWKETEEGLRLAKERAEEESAKKSDFLARISHELRTPLNAIIGFSEVMSAEKFGPIANDRYKGYLNDIRSSGDHLLSLINDLLDLSKIEAGKIDLNFTSVDVARIIEQGMKIIQPQAAQARVIVRVSLPDHLPPVVADERSLRQIVLNLLSNAVKFTPAGGQVILSAVVDEQGRLQVRVRDTGIGMSRDEIDRAMEPFRQIETHGQADHTGTGLGLPLTKALTEANRAEFLIESTPSAGTLVHITFPTNRVLDG